MGCGVVGRKLEVLVRVGGPMVHFGRERPSSLCNIITSRNGITCPCSLSEVNWMFWLMELMWASIPSTWSAGTAVRTSSTYLFENTVGTSDVL